MRRDGLDSDCKWPGEPGAQRLDKRESGYIEHLARDAEFAEELAIRYVDSHHGPRSAAKAKDDCLGALFEEIGKAHGVDPVEVLKGLYRGPYRADLEVNLAFVLCWGLLADTIIRRLLGRYPPENGMAACMAMVVFSSVIFAGVGVFAGEQWSAIAEMARVGSVDLSNRVSQLHRARNRLSTFVVLTFLFCAIAAVRARLRPLTMIRIHANNLAG